MALAVVARQLLPTGFVFAVEYYLMQVQPRLLFGLAEKSTAFGLPKMYALVGMINVLASGFTLVYLGTKVSQARKKHDVPYPKMYAEGDSEDAKRFNCVQRGHAHALETYPQFLAMSLLGGLKHPLVTAFFGVIFCYSRLKWAEGYAVGGPDARYTHSVWGKHIWSALIGVFLATFSTCVQIMLS